jgi:hypothetical protein
MASNYRLFTILIAVAVLAALGAHAQDAAADREALVAKGATYSCANLTSACRQVGKVCTKLLGNTSAPCNVTRRYCRAAHVLLDCKGDPKPKPAELAPVDDAADDGGEIPAMDLSGPASAGHARNTSGVCKRTARACSVLVTVCKKQLPKKAAAQVKCPPVARACGDVLEAVPCPKP